MRTAFFISILSAVCFAENNGISTHVGLSQTGADSVVTTGVSGWATREYASLEVSGQHSWLPSGVSVAQGRVGITLITLPFFDPTFGVSGARAGDGLEGGGVDGGIVCNLSALWDGSRLTLLTISGGLSQYRQQTILSDFSQYTFGLSQELTEWLTLGVERSRFFGGQARAGRDSLDSLALVAPGAGDVFRVHGQITLGDCVLRGGLVTSPFPYADGYFGYEPARGLAIGLRGGTSFYGIVTREMALQLSIRW